jgi:hypothetical protein
MSNIVDNEGKSIFKKEYDSGRSKLPEGATTQPTPATLHAENAQLKHTVAVLCGKIAKLSYESLANTPVPSAGSKPEDGEGECEWNGRILSKFHEFVNIYGGGKRCIKCKKEFTASIEESQPVADGGGLEPEWEALKASALDASNYLSPYTWPRGEMLSLPPFYGQRRFLAAASPETIIKLLAAYASSQEALREMTKDRNLWQEAHDEDCPNRTMADALRERMQQAVENLLMAEKFAGSNLERTAIRDSISLLSPEGSSR